MELLIIVVIAFWLITTLFVRFNWCVKNYKSKFVPYSLGAVITFMLIIDHLYFTYFIRNFLDLIYIVLIWFLGFIDDLYGRAYPKGIKGHFSYFFKRREVTTGFIKAIGVIVVSFTYFLIELSIPVFYLLCLLILLPHSMNLLDTKPLRVWKLSIFFLYVPIIILTQEVLAVLIISAAFILWAIFESKMKGMLGDNGAMIMGAWMAIASIQLNIVSYQFVLLMFSIIVTLIAERVSIQEWIERTPGIKRIDQLGRLE
ncbi:MULTISPECIES: hypothetical protein [Bacillaceae]|uniref:Prenyltransferase n=1 Tax=Evansella alkalicola TaxID=745819 RepID=A0ABS6JZS9_9BACI|nr:MULTISPECIES: hypothetical protein [Bacillaceae]MBU9724100.1 hypothetical protein [Bacillus alkalicola]